MVVLLQSISALWNRNETISAHGQTYRLQFTSGSRQAGIWDPFYFDYLHAPRQLRLRFRRLARRKNGWGGVLAVS
jgi:hypothetical protein